MIQPLGSDISDHPDHHGLASLQYGVEASENNSAKTASLLSGNVYIYDLVEQRNLSGSFSVASMLGYPSALEEPLSLAGLIHPDDLNRVAEHFQRFTTLHYDEVIYIAYRTRREDGQWCWLRSQETPLVMAIDGFPLQILGIVQVATQFSNIERLPWSHSCCESPQVSLNQTFSY